MVSKSNYEFARLIQATAMPTAHYDDAKKNIGITDDTYDIDDNFANKMADIYGEYVNTLDTTRKLSDDEIKVVKNAANDLASNHQAKASLQDVVNHSLNNNSFMNLTNTQVASSEVYENYKNAEGEEDGVSYKEMFEAFYALERDFRFHTDEVDADTYFNNIGPMIDSDIEMSETVNVDFPFATQCFELDDEIKRQFEEVNKQSTPTDKDNIRSVYPEGFADKLDEIYGKQTMDNSLILFEDDNQPRIDVHKLLERTGKDNINDVARDYIESETGLTISDIPDFNNGDFNRQVDKVSALLVAPRNITKDEDDKSVVDPDGMVEPSAFDSLMVDYANIPDDKDLLTNINKYVDDTREISTSWVRYKYGHDVVNAFNDAYGANVFNDELIREKEDGFSTIDTDVLVNNIHDVDASIGDDKGLKGLHNVVDNFMNRRYGATNPEINEQLTSIIDAPYDVIRSNFEDDNSHGFRDTWDKTDTMLSYEDFRDTYHLQSDISLTHKGTIGYFDDEMKALGAEKINQNANKDNNVKQQAVAKSEGANEPSKTMAGKNVDLVVNSLRPIHYSTKNGEQKLGVLVDASKRGDVDNQKTTFDGSHVVNTYTKYGKPSHSQIVSVESARQILNVNGVKSLPNSAFAAAANDKYDYGKELSKAGNTLTFTSNVFVPDDAKYGDFKFNPNPDVIKASDVDFNSEKHFEAVEAREDEHAANKAKFEARKADKAKDEGIEP